MRKRGLREVPLSKEDQEKLTESQKLPRRYRGILITPTEQLQRDVANLKRRLKTIEEKLGLHHQEKY
jgi:hypothetical protein